MHVRESAATRSLLFYSRGTGGLAQHPALSNENNMSVGELLLQFPCQPARVCRKQMALYPKVSYLPELDPVESLQLGHGDEDNNRLLATPDINLTGCRNLQRS